jgi:hypothetical protein
LEKLLHHREPELIDVVCSCLFALESKTGAKRNATFDANRSDQIAAKLLTSLELESRIDVRRTYGRQLIPLFRLLDVGVVRWLANFVRILSAQLQYADSFWIDVLESLLVVFELAGIDAVRNSGQRRIGRGVQVPGPSDHVRQLRLEVGSVKSPSGFPTAGGGDFQLGTSGPKTSPVKDIVVARVSPTKSELVGQRHRRRRGYVCGRIRAFDRRRIGSRSPTWAVILRQRESWQR